MHELLSAAGTTPLFIAEQSTTQPDPRSEAESSSSSSDSWTSCGVRTAAIIAMSKACL